MAASNKESSILQQLEDELYTRCKAEALAKLRAQATKVTQRRSKAVDNTPSEPRQLCALAARWLSSPEDEDTCKRKGKQDRVETLRHKFGIPRQECQHTGKQLYRRLAMFDTPFDSKLSVPFLNNSLSNRFDLVVDSLVDTFKYRGRLMNRRNGVLKSLPMHKVATALSNHELPLLTMVQCQNYT